MKVIYLGTPEFAVKPLERLIASSNEVVAVITQPDRVNGRNNKVIFSPVKELALNNGIPVYQYTKISREGVEALKEINADVMVTCAYGQILSQEVIDICPYGVINIHASILPKYRGSSPVQWALINGEETVGVTIAQTALKVDSGDILAFRKVKLVGNENSSEVLELLSGVGAECIVEVLDGVLNGTVVPVPQVENEATFCKMLKKEDGLIDFGKTAREIVNFIRGMTPWPSAYTFCQFGRLKIVQAEEIDGCFSGENGELLSCDKKEGLIVKCGSGAIRVLTVQGENARVMPTKDYLAGKQLKKGSVFCGQ